jgi:hypothetical protein
VTRVGREAAPGFDVEGPVQAEVFVLTLADSVPLLTGPCGAAAWYIEVGASEDPMAVVASAVRRVLGEPRVVHSTSWRRDRDAVVLSFVAVIDTSQIARMATVPVGRADLARGGAAVSPTEIDTSQVVEHGLRHLAWLVTDDSVVAARLDNAWRQALTAYVPEPFRHLRRSDSGPRSR